MERSLETLEFDHWVRGKQRTSSAPFYTKNRPFSQDRLGTSIGEANSQREMMRVFLQEHSEERLVELVVLLFRKTGLVESFKIDEKKLRCAALLLLKP